MVKKILLLIILIGLLFASVGCQTVAGLGNDIEWTAQATADLLEGE